MASSLVAAEGRTRGTSSPTLSTLQTVRSTARSEHFGTQRCAPFYASCSARPRRRPGCRRSPATAPPQFIRTSRLKRTPFSFTWMSSSSNPRRSCLSGGRWLRHHERVRCQTHGGRNVRQIPRHRMGERHSVRPRVHGASREGGGDPFLDRTTADKRTLRAWFLEELSLILARSQGKMCI